ncbi:MAG: sugar transferase [Chlamydiia bacterium]|nr:sugar transferase [Chlamydiia bacterium]
MLTLEKCHEQPQSQPLSPLKRTFDLVVGSLLLLLLSPLVLAVTLFIKIVDGGPIFYISERSGREGLPFRFPKFRTMTLGADEEIPFLLKNNIYSHPKMFKIKEDPRITWWGKILRRFSIDETPQLFSVLKGDMTLVGPRPPLPSEVTHYTPSERRRLHVTPGLTGLWQVSGRSNLSFEEQLKLDLTYIETQSFKLDLLILLKTIPTVLTGRGAY